MILELFVTPTGHVSARAEAGEPDRQHARVLRAFDTGSAAGLLALAAARLDTTPLPSVRYWRDFAGRYLSERCRTPAAAGEALGELAPPTDLAAAVEQAPPMDGLEYLDAALLARLWDELDAQLRARVAAAGMPLDAWMARHAPAWHALGRVCLHLVENRLDDTHPFAFLVTYAPDVSHAGRVQYQPLGRALEEYAGARNRAALGALLAPVRRAAEASALLRELFDSGDLFHPLAWTADEAYALLREAPVLEQAGLLLRLPDWWRQRTRARVSVTLGNQSTVRFDAGRGLELDVALAVGDERLDAAEWQRLLDADSGLVFLKGRWVEVDAARLREALAHWHEVKRASGESGIAFIEGMRLLAGAPRDLAAAALDDPLRDWSALSAGPALRAALEQLRHPEGAAVTPAHGVLHATLRPYQAVGREWLHLLVGLGLGGCLADDMGLGKTVQVIALLSDLYATPDPAAPPSLLVLPASLLGNWKAELARFAPQLQVRFVHPAEAAAGDLAQLARAPAHAFDGVHLVVTTYGMLLRQDWLAQRAWRVVILDEAQAIKNPGARQTRAVKRLSGAARIALTGTPVENRLGDLWSLFDFLCPGLLGSADRFKKFVRALEQREPARYAPLRELVRPYILRRLKTDPAVIRDLPEKVEMKAFCGLSRRQAVHYQRVVTQLREALEDSSPGIERRGLVLATLMRLKQICNHPSQVLGDGGYEPADSGKFQRLREIAAEIASRQERLLLFTQFREITAALAAFLAGVFGREGLVLDGATAVRRRKVLVESFQAEGGPPFMVLSLKAGGVGLNLTAASHVVHFDRWWNPAVENQATDRAFRIGQTRNVMVHKFVCRGTLEERIDALIEDKTALAREVLEGGGEALLTEMSDEQLLDVVALDVERAQV